MLTKLKFYLVVISANLSGWAFGYFVAGLVLHTWHIGQWPTQALFMFLATMALGTVGSMYAAVKQYRKLFPQNQNLEGYYCTRCFAYLHEECVCTEGGEE